MDYAHDFKRDVLGSGYDPDNMLLTFLRYKKHARTARVDCDRIALADELSEVNKGGTWASADTLNSAWWAFKTAYRLMFGVTVMVDSETLDRLEREFSCPSPSAGHGRLSEMFAEFAALTHTAGNFALMPVFYAPAERGFRSFNRDRGDRALQDYFDLALTGIQQRRFDEYFAGDHVAERFNIDGMPGGFAEYVERNRFEPYLDAGGMVAPFWPGHAAPYAVTPKTLTDVEQFIDAACTAIRERARLLAASAAMVR